MAYNPSNTYDPTSVERNTENINFSEDPPTEDAPTSDEPITRGGSENSSPLPIGGDNENPPVLAFEGDVNFNKTIYSNISFKSKVNSIFSELKSQDNIIDLPGFFKMYNRLFFDIPKEGDNSHISIIRNSSDYVNDYIDPKDSIITNLENTIEDLERQLADLNDELQEEPEEHPFLNNGTLFSFQGNVYYMDKGYARLVDYNIDFFEVLKQTLYGTNTPEYPVLNLTMFETLKRGLPNLNQNNFSDYWQPNTFISDTLNRVEAILLDLDQNGMANFSPGAYATKAKYTQALNEDFNEKTAQINALDSEISILQTEINALLNLSGGDYSVTTPPTSRPPTSRPNSGNNSGRGGSSARSY